MSINQMHLIVINLETWYYRLHLNIAKNNLEKFIVSLTKINLD